MAGSTGATVVVLVDVVVDALSSSTRSVFCCGVRSLSVIVEGVATVVVVVAPGWSVMNSNAMTP